MTTTVRNAKHLNEITAFMQKSLPCNPLPFIYALADSVKENGTAWIQSDEARAMIHLINQQSYGQGYKLDGQKEFNRLSAVFKDVKVA